MILFLAWIFSSIIFLGFILVIISALIVGARADEMAESHGDVVELPKR